MKIRVILVSEHICTDQHHHFLLYRQVFVGMVLQATIHPTDDTVYLVEIQEALYGLVKKGLLMPLIYWQMRWNGTHQLTDHIIFPRDCCEVFPELALD